MSTCIEVFCQACGQSLGDQYKPGDGIQLYKAHQKECAAQTES